MCRNRNKCKKNKIKTSQIMIDNYVSFLRFADRASQYIYLSN